MARDPVSKAQVCVNFERRVRDLKEAARLGYEARRTGSGAPRWFRPSGWDGNLFDFEAMAVPFSRADANAQFVEAVGDSEAPGTSGDIVVTTTQIDYLACLERAFRVRHGLRRSRAVAHLLARLKAHGDDRGPLVQCALEYIRNVLKQTKS